MRDYLADVADQPGAEGPQYELVLVGGALLALRDLPDTTHDMDSITQSRPTCATLSRLLGSGTT